MLLREPLGACNIGSRFCWLRVVRRTCSGGLRTCSPGSTLVILVSIKVGSPFYLQASEAESQIQAARCIGIFADKQQGESSGSYKVDMAPKNAQTIGEKDEKPDTAITGGRSTSGAQQKCMVKQDWCSGTPAGWQSVTGPTELSGKIDGEISNDMISVDQTNRRQKDRPQPAITNFFTSGGQVNASVGPSTLSVDTIMNAVENLDLTNLVAELPQAGIMSLGGVLEMGKLQRGVEIQPAETRSLEDLTGATTSVFSLVEIQLQKHNDLQRSHL
ncbi:hypothetical protein NDU88_005568 [Pleurodeles waltl]|uniref:Uncharacterized protein n=1 Tax=Pleurodeles waltl TaxID=8319 RepID=A0AAV7UJN1_PLEWA|nr:hypothetical protein NDU88_005568 [Pleurodeles waltl]